MSAYYTRADIERMGLDGCLRHMNELHEANNRIEDAVERADVIEQLARDLLARLSQDYGDSEDCDREVSSLFERGEQLLPVDRKRPVLPSVEEMARNLDTALDMVDNSLLELLSWAEDGEMPPQSAWAAANESLNILRAERVNIDNLSTNDIEHAMRAFDEAAEQDDPWNIE